MRRLSRYLLGLLLALSVALPLAAQTVDSSSSWNALRSTLHEAKNEAESLELKLTDLQNANSELLDLSNSQAESLASLSRVQSELATSLTQLSESLTTSKQQAERLEIRMGSLQLGLYIGIPAALIGGVIIGAVVTP